MYVSHEIFELTRNTVLGINLKFKSLLNYLKLSWPIDGGIVLLLITF